MAITGIGQGLISLDDDEALRAPPPPKPAVPSAPDPADVAHINGILGRYGLDQYTRPKPPPYYLAAPDAPSLPPPDTSPSLQELQRIAYGDQSPAPLGADGLPAAPEIQQNLDQPFDLGVASQLGVSGAVQAQSLGILPVDPNVPGGGGAVVPDRADGLREARHQAQSLGILPVDPNVPGGGGAVVPTDTTGLDPMQLQQMRTFGRILTPTEEIELGYRKPEHQALIAALSNPFGYAAGKLSEGVNTIPTGGGTNLGQRIENIDNPILRTAAEQAVGVAPYALAGVAGAPLGAENLFATALGEAFQAQMVMGVGESVGQTQTNDWKAIGSQLAMLFGPKLAELGIHTGAQAIEWAKSPAAIDAIKSAMANPEVRARVAPSETGALTVGEKAGGLHVPDDAAAKTRMAEIQRTIAQVSAELETAVGTPRRQALAEQLHALEQEHAQLQNRPLPGQSDMFGGVVEQAPATVHEAAPQGDLFAQTSPLPEARQAAVSPSTAEPATTGSAEPVTPADVAKIEAYHAAKGEPAPGDNVQTIPLSRVTTRPDLFQARDTDPGVSHAQAQVDKLARLQEQGVAIGPPTVVKDPATGDYITVIGHNRTELARQGGKTELPMKIDAGDINNPADLARLQERAVTSNYKTGTSFSEDARAYKSLQGQGRDPTEIRALTKAKSVGQVEDTIDAARLGDQALERMNLDKTAQGIGAELGRGVRAYGFSLEDANAMFNKFLSPDEGGRIPSRTAVRATVDLVGQAMKKGDAAQFDGFAGMGADSNAMKLLNDFTAKKQEVETAIRDAKSLQTKLGRVQKDAGATAAEKTNATRAATDAKNRQGRLEKQLSQLERGVKAEITGNKVSGQRTLQASLAVQSKLKETAAARAAGTSEPFQLKGMSDEQIAAARGGDRAALDTARGLMGEARPDLEGAKTRWDTPELIAGRARQMAELDKGTHLKREGGELVNDSPKRKAFRQQLVDNEMAQTETTLSDGVTQVPIKQGNEAYIVLGPPAAGKSSIIVDGVAREHGTRVIDSDNFKGPIAQAEGLTKNVEEGGDGVPSVVHDASDTVFDGVLDRSIGEGDNLALALVGRNAEKIDALGQRLHDAGYKVHLVDVVLPADKAAGRTSARWLEKNRLVDPDYVINRIGSAPEETYATLKGKDWVYERHQVNNDVQFGQPPITIERSTGPLSPTDGVGNGHVESEVGRARPSGEGGGAGTGSEGAGGALGRPDVPGSGPRSAVEDQQQAPADVAGGGGEPPSKPPTAQAAPSDVPPPPDASPAAIEHYLPKRQQFIDQLERAKADLRAPLDRAKALRDKAAAAKNVKPGKIVQVDMFAAPGAKELIKARADVKVARDRIKQAKDALAAADVRVEIDDFAQRARDTGGDPLAINTVVKGYRDAAELAQTARRFTEAPVYQKLVARLDAFLEGKVPDGVVNTVARAHLVVGNALAKGTDAWLGGVASKIDGVLAKANADLKFVGPVKYRELAGQFPDHAVVLHPEWFANKSPELLGALKEIDRYQRAKYSVVSAIDPRAAPALDGVYLRSVWDIPESQLTSAVAHPSGRVSITKERGWPDPFQAMLLDSWPYKLKDMSVGELVESSAHLADRQIATMLERKLILERFGVRGAQSPASGNVQFRNPNYAGWSGPKEVVNFIEQLHDPTPAAVQSFGNVGAKVKNTIFGVGDIGVFGQHLLNLVSTRGTAAAAGAINRGLDAMHLPHMQVYLDGDLPKAVQRELAGLQQGTSGAVSSTGEGTILSLFGRAGRKLDDATVSKFADKLTQAQFAGVLTPVRNMVYEGNLITAKLLGRDITSPAVKRAAAENAAAFSGGSLGALRESRRGYERAALTAPQITRSMVAQLQQVAKLATGTGTERILATATLANMGLLIYGAGSALNMLYGSGKPVSFDPRDVEWATVHLGGKWQMVDGKSEYVGGDHYSLLPQKSLIRTIGKSINAIQGEDGKQFIKAWEQFAYTRSSPLLQAPAAVTGTGFDTEGRFHTGTLPVGQRIASVVPAPIASKAVLSGETNASGLPAQISGLGSFPGKSSAEIHTGNQDDARGARTREFDALEKMGFESQFWRAKLSPVGGDPSKYGSYTEYRQAYIDRWTAEGVNRGLTPGDAESKARKHFDGSKVLQDWHAGLAGAKLRYWKEHPDELRRAYDLGIEDLSKDESRILAAQR